MNVTAPLFAPITPGEARTWTPPHGRADIAPSRYERIERDGYLTIDAHWVVPALLGPLRSRAGCWSRREPVPGRRLADSQARVEPARRRLVAPIPNTKH